MISVAQYVTLPPCLRCPERKGVFCRRLSNAELPQLLALGGPRSFRQGTALFDAGQPQGPFYKLISGMVAVFALLPNGRRQIVTVRRPGDSIGYLSEDGRYQYSGVALTDVTACAYDRSKFDLLAANNGAVGADVAAALSRTLAEAAQTLVALGQLPTMGRVAFLLCEMSRWEGNSVSALTLKLSRSDIADLLGMKVETVSRRITELRRKRIIRLLDNDVVEILDQGRLSALAGLP